VPIRPCQRNKKETRCIKRQPQQHASVIGFSQSPRQFPSANNLIHQREPATKTLQPPSFANFSDKTPHPNDVSATKSNKSKSPNNKTSAITTFAFLNIQGLHPQTRPSSVPYIRDILIAENHIFVGLTETWLSPNHEEAELEIEGYRLLRKDRDREKPKQGRYSGGVALYMRNDIAPLFEPLLEYSNGVNEALLLYSKNLNMIVGILYRQPTNSLHKSDAPEFIDLISSIISKIETVEGCTPDLYICGDFNIPHFMHQH